MFKPSAIDHILGFLRGVLFTCVVVFLPIVLAAQETDSKRQAGAGGIDTMPSISTADVQSALDAVEVDAGIDDAVKDRLRSIYKQAIGMLDEAANFAAQAAKYKEAISTAGDRTAALRRQLEDLALVDENVSVSPTASIEALQKDILSRQAVLGKLKNDLSYTKNELGRVKERPFEISSRLPEIQRELSEIRPQLVSPQLSVDVPSPGRDADQILLQAKRSRLLSESDMLEQEQLSQPIREDLLQAQYELYVGQVEGEPSASKGKDLLAGAAAGLDRIINQEDEKAPKPAK